MEEKKYLKISLGTGILIAIVVILAIALVGMYFYYNPKKDMGSVENKNIASENLNNYANEGKSNNTEDENETSSNTVKDPYEKYSDLDWYFDKKLTKIDTGSTNFVIESGTLYVEKDGEKEKINSITEKVKYIAAYGEVTIERIYAITEEGNIWRIGGSSSNYGKDELYDMLDSGHIDEFQKIDLLGKGINMTYGNTSLQICDGPYFLLESGELVNEEGNNYEDLDGKFVKSFGEPKDFQIFISSDSCMSYFNTQTHKYIRIRDESGNLIRFKKAFIQYSSANTILPSDMRFFVMDANDKLYYFDTLWDIINSRTGETLTTKKYEPSTDKTVKSFNKLDNGQIKVTFTDGTDLLFQDTFNSEVYN